uniref:Uncharacterized protein n=1 Tax=Avicennia marina TaxID=82927 RepID=Q9FPD1_AVIMR|nr:hypothetical protein [Avicennia marina]
MKATPHFLFSLCLIIFSICSNSLLCAAAEEAVLDIEGNELQAGSKYYMVSAIWGAGGGGVTLRLTGNDRCPVTVGQEGSDLRNGLPVSFQPANSEETVVRVSTQLNIKFEVSVPCANSTVWRVGRLDAWTRTSFIQIEGEPGFDWFEIEKVSELANIYKVVSRGGQNIAVIFNMVGQRILGLSPANSFLVVFRKVQPLNQAY